MKVTAELELRMHDADSARRLSAVLAPDNEGLPRGLKLSVSRGTRLLAYRVDSGSPTSAVSTALALLRDIVLFQEVWLLSRRKDARGRRTPP